MSNIKLLSGMDFSGKSTVAKCIDESMPGVFHRSSKFLTPIYTIQYCINHNIWIPPDDFIPLLKRLVRKDIDCYEDRHPILQDTLWVIKFTARLMADNNQYSHYIYSLLELINEYPQMDSFYFTATQEARHMRYIQREASGKRISKSDKLIFNKEYFEEIEKWYKFIILEKFPNTHIIDTTNRSPGFVASIIKSYL